MAKMCIPIAIILMLVVNSGAKAQGTGEQIFRECVEKIGVMKTRCISHMEQMTADCIKRIEELQSQGKHELARKVAGECIDAIRLSARTCIGNITAVCQRCIARLRELGELELAARLESKCTETRRAILNKANALIERIRSKF